MRRKSGKKRENRVKAKSKVSAKKKVVRRSSKDKSKSIHDVRSAEAVGIKYISVEGVKSKKLDGSSLIKDFSGWQEKRFGLNPKDTFFGHEVVLAPRIKPKRKLPLNFWLWPDYLKITVAFCGICLLGFIVISFLLSGFYIFNGFFSENPNKQTVENKSMRDNITVLFKETIPKTIKTTTTSSTVLTTTTSVTSTTLFICNRPYIVVGSDCCLDRDGNSICDRDDEVKPTTTLSYYVRCSSDLDCGPTRVEYKCIENVAHRQTITHACKNPSKLTSKCETTYLDDVLEICPDTKICVENANNAQCKTKYASNNFLD
ncbi:MAG: hypothetical protein KKD39_02410 [Candidatus Altiarchaeota archaeon]|nr:hypothetical protein [Candidatus Altiarchaeota archaeon]